MLYQLPEVKSYGQAEKYCLTHHKDICTRVSQCINKRLGWSDLHINEGHSFDIEYSRLGEADKIKVSFGAITSTHFQV